MHAIENIFKKYKIIEIEIEELALNDFSLNINKFLDSVNQNI